LEHEFAEGGIDRRFEQKPSAIIRSRSKEGERGQLRYDRHLMKSPNMIPIKRSRDAETKKRPQHNTRAPIQHKIET
jgi:hypothetical protein